MQMDTKTKKKIIKNHNYLLSILVPQIEYLYYPLNVEGVNQKGALFPAHIRENK